MNDYMRNVMTLYFVSHWCRTVNGEILYWCQTPFCNSDEITVLHPSFHCVNYCCKDDRKDGDMIKSET